MTLNDFTQPIMSDKAKAVFLKSIEESCKEQDKLLAKAKNLI